MAYSTVKLKSEHPLQTVILEMKVPQWKTVNVT